MLYLISERNRNIVRNNRKLIMAVANSCFDIAGIE
jgi:hypothetical protein